MGLLDTKYTVYFQAVINDVLVLSITSDLTTLAGTPVVSQLLIFPDGRYKFKIKNLFRPKEKEDILSQAESYCDDFGVHKPVVQI